MNKRKSIALFFIAVYFCFATVFSTVLPVSTAGYIIDLGIIKLHFEIGSGKDSSVWRLK